MLQAVIILLTVLFTVNISANYFDENIFFIEYNPDNSIAASSNNKTDKTVCLPSSNLTITAHGWGEGCTVGYMTDLVANYNKYRGGCVICVDYSNLYPGNNSLYPLLVASFPLISQVVTDKFNALEGQGFNLLNALLFGHSYGARLLIASAVNYGLKKIGNIDACEPAGPGFDGLPTVDPTQASNHTTCIHTSIDYGTIERNCDVDFLMGQCGVAQVATLSTGLTPHSLCPVFYNNAFTNNFPAIKKPLQCIANLSTRDASSWPAGYSMGYNKPNRWAVRGKTLYAATSSTSPFN